ncbi:MAG: hypothetical protein H5T44_03025 [Thermoplasmatales archaeon]|nr:hypothetical protein [Thermoplasmatales archaeon]
MNDEIEEAVEEIISVVNVEREKIEEDLRRFIDYGVPLSQAKDAILHKYGKLSRERKIKDIKANERGINMVGKIIFIDEKEVEVRGEKRKIFRGLIGDETAIIPFTAWKNFDIKVGDVLRIKNASSSEWEGNPRLSFSEWTEITKLDYDIELIKRAPKKYNLIDLKVGLSNVEVRGKIVEIEEREVNIADEVRKVFSGIIEDETARIRFTSWKDFSLKKDQVYRIKGAYVRSWRGAPQLIFDENSDVEKLDEEIIREKRVVPIYKVVEAGGGIDLLIEGTILELRKDSGIIFRCPKCNRRVREGVCEEDGNVDAIPDLRIRALVDDGTGAVDVIFNREISEKILNRKMEEYISMAKETMDYDIVNEEIEDKIIAHLIRVHGDSIQSDFIVTIFAKDAEIISVDVEKEADELLTSLGD